MTREMPQYVDFQREKPLIDVARQKEEPVAVGQKEKSLEGASSLINFIDEKYFKNFLDKLDAIEEANATKLEEDQVDISKVGEFLGIDIAKMRSYIDEKIPYLAEKINAMVSEGHISVDVYNSMQDVLENSILAIFNRIIWVMENFHNTDPAVQERISNPESGTRKIIDLYSKHEGQSGIASYYIDNLCADNEKLKMEISTSEGFLKKYQEYFQDIVINNQMRKLYPRGAKKLAYFKFFSELESGGVNAGNIEDMLKELDDSIVKKDEIRESEKVRQVH